MGSTPTPGTEGAAVGGRGAAGSRVGRRGAFRGRPAAGIVACMTRGHRGDRGGDRRGRGAPAIQLAVAVLAALALAGSGAIPPGPALAASAWAPQRPVAPYAWTYGSAAAVAGGSLHVLFATDFVDGAFATDAGPFQGLFVVRSDDGGKSWSVPLRVSQPDRHADRGALAAEGSSLYAVWVTQTSYEAYDPAAPRPVFFRAGTATGAWGPVVRLTGRRARADYPAVAASGGRVYVAFANGNTGDLRLSASADGGATWRGTRVAPAGAVDPLEGPSALPAIAASGRTVGLAWVASRRGALKASVSTDGGRTWPTPVLLARGGGSAAGGSPAVAALGGRLAFAWTTPRGVFVRVWEAGGWGSSARAASLAHGGYDVAVAFGPGGVLGLAWSECLTADCDTGSAATRVALSWTESPDGGRTWERPRQLRGAGAPAQRINDGASLVWAEGLGRAVVYNGWASGYTSYGLFLRASP